jgi:hypothetical protein
MYIQQAALTRTLYRASPGKFGLFRWDFDTLVRPLRNRRVFWTPIGRVRTRVPFPMVNKDIMDKSNDCGCDRAQKRGNSGVDYVGPLLSLARC